MKFIKLFLLMLFSFVFINTQAKTHRAVKAKYVPDKGLLVAQNCSRIVAEMPNKAKPDIPLVVPLTSSNDDKMMSAADDRKDIPLIVPLSFNPSKEKDRQGDRNKELPLVVPLIVANNMRADVYGTTVKANMVIPLPAYNTAA